MKIKKLPFDKSRKKKKVSLTRLKKKAWKLFSEYIRRRDADQSGFNTCVTCGVRKHWKELHASHVVPGRRLGILIDERGVYPGCYICNVHKHGNPWEYQEFLRRKHGFHDANAIIEDLRHKSKQVVKFTSTDYETIISDYEERLKKFS